MIEDGAYRRLIDLYYTREAPLPANLEAVCRLIRARTQEETAAVVVVLDEFFVRTDEGYRHKRCDEEIVRYIDKRAKAKVSAAASVESRRRAASATRSERMAAAKKKGTHTREEWVALVEVCGHQCVQCGATGHLDRDHIVPVYQGGSDSIDNIQPLCARCNASKGPDSTDHRPANWRDSLNERLATAQRTLNGGSALQSPDSIHQIEELSVGSADVGLVFDHWKTVHGKPRSKLDDKRRKLIRSALKNYSAEDLRRAIDGYKRSPWHQGKNQDGKVYDSLSLILRDAEHIDAGLKYAEQGATPQW
jgi:uncharacterized protein YdaU (DUF1376 family)